MHGPRRNHSDKLAITAQREADVKQPPGSLQSEFAHTVANILDDQSRNFVIAYFSINACE
jgi:uncharacterized protein (UPF0218 family)